MNPIVKTQNFIDVDNKQENSVFWKKHILTKFIKCKLFIFSKFTLLSNKIQNIVNNIYILKRNKTNSLLNLLKY